MVGNEESWFVGHANGRFYGQRSDYHPCCWHGNITHVFRLPEGIY